MRHRGVHVGNFYLVEKEGGDEFTREDEEVLVLFAAQAASAIANARTYRDEQRARAELEALVETSPVGVVVFNAGTGGLSSLNREAKRVVGSLCSPGQTPEQLLHVINCRRADGREVRLDELPLAQELSNAVTVRAEEIVLSAPNGRSVGTLINATPIHAADGTVVSVVVTMQDLAPLEEVERQRAEFVRLVSHELRAPLISIKGSAATALGTSPRFDPVETREFFRIIDQQADHMRRLISDLLDAGRIDSGMLSVHPEPSEVASIVDQARQTFLSGGSPRTVLIDLSPHLPRVMVDGRRIVQVLNNLLSNAASHSQVSTPIHVSAVRDDVQVAVSVTDAGRGISPEALPHLFKKRALVADSERARGLFGSGLGLVVSKGLVEAHGGRIWAESPGPGQGSRFTFTVPVAEGARGPGEGRRFRSRSRRPRKGRDRTRVLVVDDDPQMLRFVRDALLAAGFAVIATGDPRELSQLIKAENPGIVLLDLMFSETDGLELMEQVPEISDLPVIFISAYGRDETIAKALESGAVDYIVKPFSVTELTARVQAALRKRSGAEPFVLGDLAIFFEERRVTVGDRDVYLTATEFGLLRVLAENAGRVLSYDSLLRQVWKGRDTGGVELVRTFVRRLRNQLGDIAKAPCYIFTERGVGYRMASPDRAKRTWVDSRFED